MATAVKEYPIVECEELVRALLDGRKTRFWLPVGKSNSAFGSASREFWDHCDLNSPDCLVDRGEGYEYLHVPAHARFVCKRCLFMGWEATRHRLRPKWLPGDRIWVREKWAFQREGIFFAADQTQVSFDFFTTRRDMLAMMGALDLAIPKPYENPPDKWRSASRMPRWAARLVFEITSVHVKRAWDLSERSLKALGFLSPKRQFAAYVDQRWDKRGIRYADNPWGWLISVRRVKS